MTQFKSLDRDLAFLSRLRARRVLVCAGETADITRERIRAAILAHDLGRNWAREFEARYGEPLHERQMDLV